MKKSIFFLVMVAGLMAFAVPAQAISITYGLDFEFSGATPPAGSTPWLTATFDDSFGGADTVRLTLSADNLEEEEFIDVWFFNFGPTLDPTLLTFTAVDNTASVPEAIKTGVDSFKADGDGYFDIVFDFPQSNGAFTEGESVIYDIVYVGPISALSFAFGSAPGGGNGTFTSAAHIQGIGLDGEDSGWIGSGDGGSVVPEPATLLLLGSGLMGIAGLRKRRLSRQKD